MASSGLAHGNGGLRAVVGFFNFMIFCSAAVTTGVISYFLRRYRARGSHIVYIEVIAVITMAFYFFATCMPLLSVYEGFFLPVDLILTYLWLTSFILAVVDWKGDLCQIDLPGGGGSCSLKRTVEAFTFIAFFFLLCDVVAEGFLWRASRRMRREDHDVSHDVTKSRPVSGFSGHTETSATPVAHYAGNTATPAFHDANTTATPAAHYAGTGATPAAQV